MCNKQVGELRGGWALLFKLCVATYPFLIMWAVFITASVMELKAFERYGDRFSVADGEELRREFRQELDKLPPPHVDIMLEQHAEGLIKTMEMLIELEREVTRDFLRKNEHQPHPKNLQRETY